MNKPPLWFSALAVVALLWNLAGLFAVLGDLRLSAAEIAALPQPQQALYAARPGWSVVASVIAVAGGTLGCIGLLVRKRWAAWVLFASLVGIVVQDIGIFMMAGANSMPDMVPVVLQGVVLIIAAGLLLLARTAAARGWLR